MWHCISTLPDISWADEEGGGSSHLLTLSRFSSLPITFSTTRMTRTACSWRAVDSLASSLNDSTFVSLGGKSAFKNKSYAFSITLLPKVAEKLLWHRIFFEKFKKRFCHTPVTQSIMLGAIPNIAERLSNLAINKIPAWPEKYFFFWIWDNTPK